MGDIIYYSSENLDKAAVFTNSVLVAERFGKRHSDVIRAIEKKLSSKNEEIKKFNERNFALVDYTDKKGESRKMYEMNEDGFLNLAMGFTGEEAEKIRILLISEFRRMEKELSSRAITRQKAIEARNRMTDTIKDVYEGSKLGFKIKAFTDLVYSKVIGQSAKKFRKENSLDKTDNIRDYLTEEQLKEVDQIEATVATLYSVGHDYQSIKKLIGLGD